MSIGFVLGNLVGRAIVSYLLLWLLWFCVSRFDWRRAFVRSRRWYSMVALVALTLAGMGSAVVKAGGVA